ncbi:metallophosphoesterase family protein [Sphingomonas psychrotolerans]|uniref:metallophosphoesterase family protein n=1 Tax=Sphingomonas psychrotolerans TaxID=1327635 RepID=UPI002D78178F|nr:metallophosphoesterase family protein [Sphingomonas psychrotolerans]
MPAGQRIYAIGDIHGRLDLLNLMLDRIAQDDRARGAAESHLILLGDLIDRGPQSADVVQRAIELERTRARTHFLLGNHEEVFLKAIGGDLKALAFFTRIGGKETILSYGIADADYRNAGFPELLELWRANVPPAHIEFLNRCEDLLVFGDYAFVHAGVRPDRPLDSQKASDLRWIRDEFLGHSGDFEKIIVHGHTITEDVESLAHRVGLDTGAYLSGKLSAMGFEGTERWILQTEAPAAA